MRPLGLCEALKRCLFWRLYVMPYEGSMIASDGEA